ncbi:Uu.00g110150.m01.CDS01 [Anthostomella pinea]|uniref:Uu.00g110150.m01.CDS01 n=1 Tax=Anthostomella pinea TaxID=933095 RepID=A0AAI8V9P5_9PEZI|nr:Uu.00g110150.m01.CDS01 [Anthostomella pinea]
MKKLQAALLGNSTIFLRDPTEISTGPVGEAPTPSKHSTISGLDQLIATAFGDS